MTDTNPENLPARALPPEMERLRTLGRWLSLAESGGNDQASLGAAAALRFAYVEALGLPLLAATEISVIRGRLVTGAKLVRALANLAGFTVKRGASSAESVTAVLVETRTGTIVGETTYTIEDARQAGLVRSGGGYVTNPERMLWARASKRVVDDFAPQVSLGLVTPEEQDEIPRLAADAKEYADYGSSDQEAEDYWPDNIDEQETLAELAQLEADEQADD